jgi:putative transposase
MGGWIELKALRKIGERIKGDERILGDSTFVEKVLRASDEKIDHQYRLRAKGYDLNALAKRVAEVLGVGAERL